MKISGTVTARHATGKRRDQAPVPAPAGGALTVHRDAAARPARHSQTTNPNRRSAAFLAQLALQYDGRAARKRARAERLELAVASYTRETWRRADPHRRTTHDLKI